MCFESQLGLLNHLSKLEQNSESSETSSIEKIDDGREPYDDNEEDDENPSSKHKCELCYLCFNGSAELSQHLMVRNSAKVKAYVSTTIFHLQSFILFTENSQPSAISKSVGCCYGNETELT